MVSLLLVLEFLYRFKIIKKIINKKILWGKIVVQQSIIYSIYAYCIIYYHNHVYIMHNNVVNYAIELYIKITAEFLISCSWSFQIIRPVFYLREGTYLFSFVKVLIMNSDRSRLNSNLFESIAALFRNNYSVRI